MMVLKICIFLLFLTFIYVGYRYVKEGTRNQKESEADYILLKRRENAKRVCPINSNGTSMDNREIYVLTSEELGLR